MTMREAAGGTGAGARQAAGVADGLVGRADVLARLGHAVDDAVAGHGGLVLLTGEAGIGKTTVAARAAAEAERKSVLAVWGSGPVPTCPTSSAGRTGPAGRWSATPGWSWTP